MSKDHVEKAELLQEVECDVTSTGEHEGKCMIQQDQEKKDKYNSSSTLEDRNRPNLRHSLSSASSAESQFHVVHPFNHLVAVQSE